MKDGASEMSRRSKYSFFMRDRGKVLKMKTEGVAQNKF